MLTDVVKSPLWTPPQRSSTLVSVSDEWNTLAGRIDWARKRLGLTRRALARKAGLSENMITAAISRGGNFNGPTGLRVAEAAGVDYNWLATGKGSPEPLSQPTETATVPSSIEVFREVADRLVRYDGLSLERALVLLHGIRPPSPTVEGYYFAARDRLLLELEQGEMRKIDGPGRPRVTRAQKR